MPLLSIALVWRSEIIHAMQYMPFSIKPADFWIPHQLENRPRLVLIAAARDGGSYND
jgi:hypothetical protein